ncbi:Hypothetical protein HDN1F_26520 [gamma proteobacterium HdN1]|nr:Hypothetical protein HDN1F_26520 [gamma proteobacterium HdN1]
MLAKKVVIWILLKGADTIAMAPAFKVDSASIAKRPQPTPSPFSTVPFTRYRPTCHFLYFINRKKTSSNMPRKMQKSGHSLRDSRSAQICNTFH